MTHSIYASAGGKRIASLDYVISERNWSRLFYRLIDASDLDGGCSGINDGRRFSKDILETAYNCYTNSGDAE